MEQYDTWNNNDNGGNDDEEEVHNGMEKGPDFSVCCFRCTQHILRRNKSSKDDKKEFHVEKMTTEWKKEREHKTTFYVDIIFPLIRIIPFHSYFNGTLI